MATDNAKKVIRDIVVISETEMGTDIKVKGTGGEIIECVGKLLASLAEEGNIKYSVLVKMLLLMGEDK